MPTYDYICADCGHEMEAFHSMSAPALTLCPSCGKSGLRRRIGPGAGLLFKGSGFYITDYRSEGYKKAASSESGTASAGAKSSESATSKAAPAATAG